MVDCKFSTTGYRVFIYDNFQDNIFAFDCIEDYYRIWLYTYSNFD
jgi:hypothetical protein